MPAVHGHQQIGLFGLGGHAGAWTAALHVDDNQGQFGHDRQADPSAFKATVPARWCRWPRWRRRSRADGGHTGGDFVLGLQGADVVFLILRQFVQDSLAGVMG